MVLVAHSLMGSFTVLQFVMSITLVTLHWVLHWLIITLLGVWVWRRSLLLAWIGLAISASLVLLPPVL